MLNLYLSRTRSEEKVRWFMDSAKKREIIKKGASLFITPLESKEAVIEDLRSAGSDEEVIGFVSVSGNIADAIKLLALGQENITDWEAFLFEIADIGFQMAFYDEDVASEECQRRIDEEEESRSYESRLRIFAESEAMRKKKTISRPPGAE